MISFYCRGLPASPPRAARLRPPPPVPWSQRSSSCTRHGQSLSFHHALGTTDSLQESRRPRDQFLLSRSAGISPRVLPVSVLLTTPRERISPKQSSRASQLFLGPPRLATRVGRARKHERIRRGGRKRAKRRGGGGRRCPRCPALRALRHRSAPFWRKKAEAKKPLRTRLAEPRRPWATRSNLFLSALLSPRLFFTREGCAFFIAKGWGRACENYRGVPEHETQGNRETKRSLEKGEVA